MMKHKLYKALICIVSLGSIAIFYTYAYKTSINLNQKPDSTVCLFAHGLFDSSNQALPYDKLTCKKGSNYLFECPVVAFDFPDGKKHFPWCDPSQTSLGQENEIACLAENFALQQEQSDDTIILFGISRGAVTALNYTALHNPNIKALIVESPYDYLEKVVDETPFMKYSWIPHIFKKHDCNGIQPIDCIDAINKHLPILIICSKQDSRISYKRSLAVYEYLIKTGHFHTHILILENGKHAKLLNGADGTAYQHVAHAFLSHYNLPHNPLYALRGQADFAQTQPTAHSSF